MPFFRLRYFLLFIALLIFCLIWTAPAWLMTKLVTSASKGSIEIENPEGGFWTGHANAINYINNKKTLHRFEDVSWAILPIHLLKGDIAVRITITDHQLTADGVLSTGLSGKALSDLRASLPAELVSNFIPDVRMLLPRGSLDIKIPSLALESFLLKQPANIQWKNAGLNISKVSPLGDYSVDITTPKESIEFNLQTLKGPLTLTGKGSYNNKTGGTFNGYARTDENYKPQLSSLLQLMGRPQENGNVNVFFRFPPIRK